MHLANPWALWFLPLAALPVIIHLFRPRPTTAVPFPDVRFLLESPAVSWRSSRLRELVLLALRTLALLLLALALARPSVNAALPRWLGGGQGAVVLVVDDSASMGASDGDGTLFDRARREAAAIVGALAPDARAAVISAAAGSRVVCGLGSPEAALRRLGEMAPTDLGTDIPAAAAAAVRLAERSARTAAVVIISDLQRSGFGAQAPLPAPPPGGRLEVVEIAARRQLRNLAWDTVRASPVRKRIIAAGRIAGAAETVIRLERNGRVLYSRTVTAGEQGAFTASFGWPDADSLVLRCAGDDLPADDAFYLPFRRLRLEVLLAADSADAGYLARALAAMAGEGITVTQAPAPSREQWDRADAIVFCRRMVPRELADRMRQRLGEGVPVLVVPPAAADVQSYNRHLMPAIGGGELLSLARPGAVGPRRRIAPAAAGGLGPEIDDRMLSSAEIGAYWQARAEGLVAATVDGQPALIVRDRAALWLVGAEPAMGTLVYQPAFVVLLHRVLAVLAAAGGLKFTGDAVAREPGAPLAGPGGAAVRTGASGASWSLDRAGWYRMPGGGSLAVNLPSRESDLTPLSTEERRLAFGDRIGRSGAIPGNGSSPLERALLLSALAVLSAEALARTRRRRDRMEKNAGKNIDNGRLLW